MELLAKDWNRFSVDTFRGIPDLSNVEVIRDPTSGGIIIITCPAHQKKWRGSEWSLVKSASTPWDHIQVRRSHAWRVVDPDELPFRRSNEFLGFPNCIVRKRSALTAANTQLEKTFAALVTQWRSETRLLSSMSKKLMHPAYLRIIGLGPRVLPLILRQLKEEPAYWFRALSSIAGEDPIPPNATFDQAVRGWISWGEQRGLI